MFRLPEDHELYAGLPGTDGSQCIGCETMAELYDRRLVKVRDNTAAGSARLSEDCIRQRQQDAMGRWVQGYLRQRRPIGAYPAAAQTPGMTENVGRGVRRMRDARKKLEDTRPKKVVLKLCETALLYLFVQLCWKGLLLWEVAEVDLAALSGPQAMQAFLVSMWIEAGMVVSYVSFVASLAGSVIMLLRLADRAQVQKEFLDSVDEYAGQAYLYLRFCQLWCSAQGQKLPEDLTFGLREINRAVRLYNRVLGIPAA